MTGYLRIFAAAAMVCFTAGRGDCLSVPYGSKQIERAGAGCVAGYTSSFGSEVAYYRGSTKLLNRKLRALNERFAGWTTIELRIHDERHTIPAAEETPLGAERSEVATIQVDWSVSVSELPGAAQRSHFAYRWRPAFDADTERQTPYRIEPALRVVIEVWTGGGVDAAGIDVPSAISIGADQ